MTQRDSLFATGWVHVFEEDTAKGAVFKPDSVDIPLSRRPRERIHLEPDGKARVSLPGADDRYMDQPANWRDDGGHVVIRTAAGAVLRIVEQSATRLVVKMS